MKVRRDIFPSLLFLFAVVVLTWFVINGSGSSTAQSSAVIYLTHLTAAEGLADSERAAADLNALVVRSNEEARSVADVRGIIIDRSMQDIVDRTWLAERYRQGIVVGMINIAPADAAQLVGDFCFANADIQASPNSFVIVSYYAIGDDPVDVAQVNESNYRSCSQDSLQNVNRSVITGFQRSIDTSSDYSYFAAQFQSHIHGIDAALSGYRTGAHNSSR
ncbi:MAG: hypothetical protein SF029_12310 [bacterium]|nr:hypothetical protein [bacterium]